MSSFWLIFATGSALAHEVVPAIADFSVSDGVVRIEMRVNVEAQLSGIDLDEVADTDNAENASDYDDLRALPVGEVATRAADLLRTWNATPLVVSAGEPVELTLDSVTVPDVERRVAAHL